MKFIIKADDFSLDRGGPEWLAFLTRAAERQVPVSVGVVGWGTASAVDRGVDLPALVRGGIERGTVEVWNHGWSHRRDEFTNGDVRAQLDSIDRTQRVLRALGIANAIFGVPYNRADAATPLACAAHPDIRLTYDVPGHGPVQSAAAVPRVSIENRQIGFDVDVRQFLRTCTRLAEEGVEVAILQVHPVRWSALAMEAFSQVVARALHDGHQFITLARWALERGSCLANLPPDERPDVALAELGQRGRELVRDRRSNPRLAHEFFSSRYEVAVDDYVERVRAIGFDAARGRRLRVLDVGAGVGQWSLAVATACPDASVEAIDPGGDFLDILARCSAGTGMEARVRARELRAELIDYPDDSFDLTLIPGVLMYCEHETVVRELSRVTVDGGRHYVAYHQDGHYVMKIARACREGDLARARNWTRIFAGIKQFNAGLHDGLEAERCLPEDRLLRLYALFGFDLVARPSVWRDEPPRFGRLPAISELVLAKRAQVLPAALGHDPGSAIDELVACGAAVTAMRLLDERRDLPGWQALWTRAAVAAGETQSVVPDHQEELDPTTRFLYLIATGATSAALELAPALRERDPARASLVVYALRQARLLDDARALARELIARDPEDLDFWAAHLYMESLSESLSDLQQAMDRLLARFGA